MQDIGKKSYTELSKVIPSFIRRAEPNHKYQKVFAEYQDQMLGDVKMLSEKYAEPLDEMKNAGVRLSNYDVEAPYKVAAALLFSPSKAGLHEIQEMCRDLSQEELGRILDAGCSFRESRRHKSPRALEHADFTFEIVADYGIYRDLHRHRMLTQDRQLLSCDYGYYIPHEIKGTEMESRYRNAMDEAKKAYDNIAGELPEEAEYVVPMAYNVHWYFHVNLRQLQWLCELRSSPAGHPSYRYIAQEMAKQVVRVFPIFDRFFRFVDYDGYELGRLGQEIRIVEKAQVRSLHHE